MACLGPAKRKRAKRTVWRGAGCFQQPETRRGWWALEALPLHQRASRVAPPLAPAPPWLLKHVLDMIGDDNLRFPLMLLDVLRLPGAWRCCGRCRFTAMPSLPLPPLLCPPPSFTSDIVMNVTLLLPPSSPLLPPRPPGQVVSKVGGTIDDSEMVDGMVFDQKVRGRGGWGEGRVRVGEGRSLRSRRIGRRRERGREGAREGETREKGLGQGVVHSKTQFHQDPEPAMV